MSLALLVGAAYAICSQLAFSWFGADGTDSSFFPAAGVTMAALVLARVRLWPVLLAAAGVAEFTLDVLHDIGPVPSAGYVVANLVQPVVGATVLRAVQPRVDLARTRDLLAFLAVAVVAAPAVGAALGATTFVVLDGGSGWLDFALEWWVGDGLGVLVVGAAIVSLAAGRPPLPRGTRFPEAAAILAVSAVATWLLFAEDLLPLVFVPVALLVICGFRVGTPAVAFAGATVAFIAAHSTAGGHQYWDVLEVDATTGLLYLQLTLGAVIAIALAVAAEVTEREAAALGWATAERSREISDAAPAMLWVTDAEDRCTYLSRGWFEYTGQTEGGGLGLTWAQALHPDDRERSVAAFRDAAARREEFAIDYRLRRHDGEYRWAIDSGRPRHDATGRYLGFVGSVIDQHDRHLAQEARRESDARYRTLFSSIDEGYALCEILLDDAGRPHDYRFLEVNPAFVRLAGFGDPTGRTAREIHPVADRWLEAFGGAALEGRPARFEEHSERLGQWFELHATPMPPRGRFALVISDVTARRTAADSLRLSEQAERRARRRAEFLAEVVGEMEATPGLRARADRLLALLVPDVADAAALAEPGEGIVSRRGGGDGRPDVVAGLTAATLPPAETGTAAGRRSRLTVAATNGHRGGHDPDLLAGRCSAHLAVPLDPGRARTPVLHLWAADGGRPPFADDDVAFVEDVADRAALLLDAARILEDERETAMRLQRALLPGTVGTYPGVEIATRYSPAAHGLEVGGDWYDAFPLPDGKMGVVVGDVVGHGLEAAADMGGLRVALGALAPHADGPGHLLSLLDGFARSRGTTRFATVLYGILDPRTGEFRYATAGHPPPVLLTASGEVRWLEGGRSVPLCAIEVGERPEATAVLDPGSLLVLYSDGLVERRREPLQDGFGRLEEIVRGAGPGPADRVCDALMSGLATPAPREDDAVVLCLRRLPEVRPPFTRTVPGDPAALVPLRRALRGWLEENRIPEPARMDVLLAVGEATANSVEHGLRDAPDGGGEVRVRVDRIDGGVRVEVRDDGVWHDPSGDRRDRGRGLELMRKMSARFDVSGGEDGTTVVLVVPAGEEGT